MKHLSGQGIQVLRLEPSKGKVYIPDRPSRLPNQPTHLFHLSEGFRHLLLLLRIPDSLLPQLGTEKITLNQGWLILDNTLLVGKQ